MISNLSLFVFIPLLVYIVDGYYQKNIKRGLLQIVAFITTGIVTAILIKTFGLYFIIAIPVILLEMIVLKIILKKKG